MILLTTISPPIYAHHCQKQFLFLVDHKLDITTANTFNHSILLIPQYWCSFKNHRTPTDYLVLPMIFLLLEAFTPYRPRTPYITSKEFFFVVDFKLVQQTPPYISLQSSTLLLHMKMTQQREFTLFMNIPTERDLTQQPTSTIQAPNLLASITITFPRFIHFLHSYL